MRRAAAIASGLLLAGFILVVVLFARGLATRRDPTSTSPRDAYRALLADPIPAAVSDLQGGGTTWQGYSIALRFRAPTLESAGITQPPYESADCAHVVRDLTAHPLEPSPFAPAWEVPEDADATCLEASELSNAWTTLGNHSVLHAGGWVFFVARGS